MSGSAAPDDPRRRMWLGLGPVSTPRPPHALVEAAFLDRCTRCGDCVRSCPEQVLVAGDGGFPVLDPAQGACTFCAQCADACGPKALDPARARDWPWRAMIGEACLAAAAIVCNSCRDACAERAITTWPGRSARAPSVDASRCTGCGACVAACPVSTIALAAVPGAAARDGYGVPDRIVSKATCDGIDP